MKLFATLLAGLISLLFGCDSKAPYEKRNGVWHFDGRPLAIKQPDQFQPLIGPFAKGADHGYYRGGAIEDSDGPSFEALDEQYARDKSRAWYCGTARKSQEYYSIRHNRIIELDGVEASKFRLLSRSYARDERKLFFEGTPIPVKDLNSFEVLDNNYARDKVTGYHLQKPIPGTDGATFTAIDMHYSKDKASVFYYATDYFTSPVTHTIIRVAGANAATFTVMENPNEQADARDAHATYRQGKRVPPGEDKARGI